MESLELILFLLIAVVASSLLSQFLRGVSLPLVQILLGAVIAFATQTPLSSGIDAELLLILFIAPLHFNESRHVDSGELWSNRRGIALLATGLVLVIMVSVGFTLHALIPTIPLAAAIAFAAAMGSTDAMAVTALSRDMRFGKRHEALLAGEALFNDVLGTVGFQCAIAVVVSGAFSLSHAGEEIALELFGGLAAGTVMGFAAWALLSFIREHVLDNPTVHVMLEVLTPFVIYLACEHIGVGGVLAVVASGLVMSLMPQRVTASTARLRIQSKSVWETIEFVLNGVIFVVLGMQLPSVLTPALEESLVSPGYLVACVLVLTVVLEGVRFLWILGMDVAEARRCGRSARSCLAWPSLKGTLAMALAGPKGGITLSLILTIPTTVASGAAFPQRTELMFLASGVILCTLLLANYAVPLLVRRKSREKHDAKYVDAEIALYERVIASIEADAHATGAVRQQGAVAVAGAIPAISGLGARHEVETALGLGTPAAGAVSSGAAAAEAAASETAFAAGATDLGAAVVGAAGVLALSEVDEPATALVMKRYADRIEELSAHASAEVAARGRALVARVEELCRDSAALARELEEFDDDEGDAEEARGDETRKLLGELGASGALRVSGESGKPKGSGRPKERACEGAESEPAAVASAADGPTAAATAESEPAAGESVQSATPFQGDFAQRMAAMRTLREAVDDVQDQALVRELELIKAMRKAGELSAEHAKSLRNDVYVQQIVRG